MELEGWSTSAVTKAPDSDGDYTPIIKGAQAQDYNSSRSNKYEWWAGPDEDDDDEDGDTLDAIHDVELGLLSHVTSAQAAVAREDQNAASTAFDAFIDTTEDALRPALDKCGTGVCETVRENSDGRVQGIRIARGAVEEEDWAAARRELEGVEEIVLSDIERLDDELVARDPGRPRFIDIIEYLRDAPTIGESFSVCLPDASLPGDRGSLAEVLTLDHVLAYFASSYEPDGRRTPFNNLYDPVCCFDYTDDNYIDLDGPISLHEDVARQNILSAKLDTYTTENRAIVGDGTDGGTVVSAAAASADTDGKRVFLASGDVTGELILGEDRDMVMPGDNVSVGDSGGDGSVSPSLVCPVTVTPEDCPCPLPGLFYLKRVRNDDQIVFAGGWVLDEGALFEDSVTLLFAEGPTEVASVTPEDIESDDYDDRIVEQFSRDRSRFGSALVSGAPESVADSGMMPGPLGGILEGDNDEQMADGGGGGVDILGMEAEKLAVSALDAPLVHLAGAGELSKGDKVATGRIETGVINSGEEVDIL
ncbi:hypothetical protein K6T25_15230 (plasmid) [Halobaculum rubrum]|nr:hypothetical protein K6T25_15230 [Halobaculum rubrum]